MSSVLDTLEVVFSADMTGLSAGLMQLSQQLLSLRNSGDAAISKLNSVGSSLNFGLAQALPVAQQAGLAIGNALAGGIAGSQSVVDQAASALVASAQAILSRLSGLSVKVSGSVTGVSGFSTSTLSGGSSGTKSVNVTVPINVDGVKLGEACVKSVNKLGGMTGNAAMRI